MRSLARRIYMRHAALSWRRLPFAEPSATCSSQIGLTSVHRNVRWSTTWADKIAQKHDLQDIVPFLIDEVGLKPQQVARMFERHPEVVNCSAADARAVVNYLHLEAGMQRPLSRAAAVRMNPALLTAGVEALAATLAELRNVCSDKGVKSIVTSCHAALLMTPAEIQLRKSLLSDLDISFDKVAEGHPSLLIKPWHEVQATFDFLCSEGGGGMNPMQVARLAQTQPMLLTYEPERHLGPLVNFIRSDLGVDPASDLAECLYAWPRANMYRETVNFLTKTMGYSLEELRSKVDILAYSLEQSMGPRGTFVLRHGLPRPPLETLAKIDDQRFCLEVGVELTDFRKFLAGLRAEQRKAAVQQAVARREAE